MILLKLLYCFKLEKEGCKMDIYDIELREIKVGGFNLEDIDGLCHVKSLPYLSVVRVVEGNYFFGLDNKNPEFTGEGGLFIAPSNRIQTIVHKINSNTGRMKADWIFIDASVNGSFSFDEVFIFPQRISVHMSVKWHEIFDEIKLVDNICDKKILGYRLIKLLISVGTEIPLFNNEDISVVCRYIRDNYSKNIKVKELADILNMSESNFYAVFKRYVGLSPISYINNCRLSAAAKLLICSQTKIKEVAARTGFKDPYYFSKVFHAKYGNSPKDYRELNRRFK